MQPTQARIEQIAPEDEDKTKGNALFPPVPLKMARNFFVADTYFESPVGGTAPTASDKTDSLQALTSFSGLSGVPNDIKDLLPPQCRQAFDDALERDKEWKSKWGTESESMSRRQPVIDKAIVPYSMQ